MQHDGREERLQVGMVAYSAGPVPAAAAGEAGAVNRMIARASLQEWQDSADRSDIETSNG